MPDPVLRLICKKHGTLIREVSAEEAATAIRNRDELLEYQRCRKCRQTAQRATAKIMGDHRGYVANDSAAVRWSDRDIQGHLRKALCPGGKTEIVRLADSGNNPTWQ